MEKMTYETKLPNGVFTANLTPLQDDLKIDKKKLIRHLQWLLENGSNGLALLGTTGEANSFSLRERMDLLDTVFQSGIPGHKCMVGTGCCAYTDTIELTKHALKYDAGGILMLPPFYYKQISFNGLYDYFRKIIDGVGSNMLRIYLYHFPKMSGVSYSMEFINAISEEYPGIVVGMKDSSGDLDHMKQIIQNFPGFKLYAGTEKYLLDVLETGGAGCISATVNATVLEASKVYRGFSGKNALVHQKRLSQIRASFDGLPFVGVLKQYFAESTQDDSWLNMRPPNAKIDEMDYNILIEKLKALHFSLTV